MEFLKRAADVLTHAEEREAIRKRKELQKQSEIVVPVTPMADVTPSVAVMDTSADITTLKAATVDTIARAPVIDETIIKEEKEVIQPVIHREIERTEIHHVIQPVYQEEVVPTKIHERTLAPEYKEDIRAASAPMMLEKLQQSSALERPEIISTTAAARVETVVNEPIVHEIIKPHIIEEVRPVIHRTVHEPHIIRERKDIYEKIVEAPTEVVETREPIYEKEVIIPTATKVEFKEAY